jgi:hypothetical protein
MKLGSAFVDAPPFPEALIALEETFYGWRGLTARGELLEVHGENGTKATLPEESVLVTRGAVTTRVRTPAKPVEWRIDEFMRRHRRSTDLTKINRHAEALEAIDATIELADTPYARFNRAMILLALGRWREGFAEYYRCEQAPPFERPVVREARAAGLKLWTGQEIAGKRLLLVHAHGHGDTIMCLRYVETLRTIGADVVLMVPESLRQIAEQFAPLVSMFHVAKADFVCPILQVPGLLSIAPDRVKPEAYVAVDPGAVEAVRAKLGPGRHVGIAWLTGDETLGDYPRAMPLAKLVKHLSAEGVTLHSVQKQGAVQALGLGVEVHKLPDFTACAALMMAMDRVATIDTAAAHLAGAIGHPRIDLLLSSWASWRWLAPWYHNITLHRQAAPGDWDSALAQLDHNTFLSPR